MRLTDTRRMLRVTPPSDRHPSNLRLTFAWKYNGLRGSRHCCVLWGYYAGNRPLRRSTKRSAESLPFVRLTIVGF